MSSTGTHLGNTPLNLAKLRELSRRELPEILDKVTDETGRCTSKVIDPTYTRFEERKDLCLILH